MTANDLHVAPAFQDLEREQGAPWDALPFAEQEYYYPDAGFERYYGVHTKGDTVSR